MCVLDKQKNMTMEDKKVNMEKKHDDTFAMQELERTILVPVESHIYSYITQSRQSEVITLERDSTLLAIMKPHLELKPVSDEDAVEVPEGYKMLRIVVPELRHVYNHKKKKVIYCDTLFRDNLSPKGVKKVNKFFKDNFKDKFRVAMDIYVEKQYDEMSDSDEQHRIKLKKGITTFLLQYHIEPTEKLIRSLKMDYIRHRDKNEMYRYSPVFY